MERARRPAEPVRTAEIIDFDQALLAACPPELRDELMTEAAMLAAAFAPEGRTDQIEAMAQTLSVGDRDPEMGRVRARKLAAALRALARS